MDVCICNFPTQAIEDSLKEKNSQTILFHFSLQHQMRSFLRELKERNNLLYWFGIYNFIIAILCVILMQFDHQQILNVSRWLKPMKFYFSVWIMTWTMSWLLYYSDYKKATRKISWLIVISMFTENFVILLQSIRGERSHFNVQNATNGMLFSIMGIFIVIFTLVIIYSAWLFFRQKTFSIPLSYLWGIRLGLVFFIIFSIEGGIMLSRMSHTVGGPDGGPGLPVFNWSSRFGDLRIAHFLGMHSLQLLPLAGFYIFKKLAALLLFAIMYFSSVMIIFVMSLQGTPLFR